MVVEAAVFDGEHRLHHARRNRGQRDPPTLFTARADERGEQRRIERDTWHRRAVHLDDSLAAAPSRQLALFPEASPILTELEALDLNTLMPVEALNKLFEWKARFGKRA